jgi:hypothetical protein
MKLAFCLSGHVRNFSDCKESFVNHIVNQYNPDIFVHTWDEYGYGRNGSSTKPINEKTKLCIEKNKHLGLAENTEILRGTSKIDQELFSDLNVKEIIIENYDEIEPDILRIAEKVVIKDDIDYPPNFISAMRKVKLCNELRKQYEKQNGFQYDVVIKARPDLVYQKVFIDENPKQFFTTISQSYGFMSDIFYYSNSSIMDKFCTFYDLFETYIEKGYHFNPHRLMLKHLEDTKIPFCKDSRLNMDILRR